MSVFFKMDHYFMSVSGSKFYERVDHFFLDIRKYRKNVFCIYLFDLHLVSPVDICFIISAFV